jgi:hypothetical protein
MLASSLNNVKEVGMKAAIFTSSSPPPYGTFAERIASPDAMRFPLPDGSVSAESGPRVVLVRD